MKTLFLVPVALMVLTLPALAGCDGQESEPASDRVGTQSVSARYVISSSAQLSPDEIEAISKTLSGQAKEVTSAQVAAEHESVDGKESWTITTDLSAAELPGEEVFAKLQQEIPALAGASFTVEETDGPASPHPAAEIGVGSLVETAVKEGASDEDIEDEVVDKLRAQGVDGDIFVEVSDDDDGHKRVEVEVEEHRSSK